MFSHTPSILHANVLFLPIRKFKITSLCSFNYHISLQERGYLKEESGQWYPKAIGRLLFSKLQGRKWVKACSSLIIQYHIMSGLLNEGLWSAYCIAGHT